MDCKGAKAGSVFEQRNLTYYQSWTDFDSEIDGLFGDQQELDLIDVKSLDSSCLVPVPVDEREVLRYLNSVFDTK